MARRVRLLAAASLLAAPLLAQSADAPEIQPDARLALVSARHAKHQAGIPSDDELQLRGARIGNIDVQVDDIFEQELSGGGRALAAPYRLANELHITTHDATIAQQLLFHSGERYDRRLLDETERLLRAQHYLNDASITPVSYNADNTVDVRVRVHDVWTLSPGFSFGRKGGQNSTRLEFEDTNFLGLGKQVSLARASDVDRAAWRLGYIDPNLFGSRWKLSTAVCALSDGSGSELALERPFYSLETRWGANIAASDTTTSVPRYSLGRVVERIDMQERSFELGGGLSSGLHDGWTTRYLGGVRYDAHSFAARADDPQAFIPPDRVVAYPWIGFEVLEDEFVSTRNLDQIGRTEDLYLGRSARVEAGWASTAFGSTRDAMVLNGTLQAGADLGRGQYLINTLQFKGRLEGGEIADGLLELGARYYRRQSDARVLFASLGGSLAADPDPEEQLLLGGDNGLRGYPLRYQAGTASALVTLEQRFYTNWQPLKLVNVGAAVFFDAGRTWGHDDFAAPSAGWLKDIGIGLRLGSVRSGLGNVLHVDLAFPLDGGSDIDSVQLLIETRRSF